MQIGGDLLLYICGGILSKILNEFTPEKAIKHLNVSPKWLLSLPYNPKISQITEDGHYIGWRLNFHSSEHENFFIFGDICVKNIDLLTNHPKYFQNSDFYETDFHKLTSGVFKTSKYLLKLSNTDTTKSFIKTDLEMAWSESYHLTKNMTI